MGEGKEEKGANEEAGSGTIKMFKVLLMCFDGWWHRVRASGPWKSLHFRCVFPYPKLPAEKHGLENCLQIWLY